MAKPEAITIHDAKTQFSRLVRRAEAGEEIVIPFDRMLVDQAQAEGFAIATGDPRIARYGVEVVW